MAETSDRIYRVVFFNQGQVWEVYAHSVGTGALPGFVEVADLAFGERSQVVIDPTEEKLRAELKGVRRFHVPMHAVVRVDEVERAGSGRITAPAKGEGDGEGAVARFPAIYRPGPVGEGPASK